MGTWDQGLWVGGMVWDTPGGTIPSQWDTRMGWVPGTKASSGLDGVGYPGGTHTIPVGHRDGMGSWDQGLFWAGWCGISQWDWTGIFLNWDCKGILQCMAMLDMCGSVPLQLFKSVAL